MPIQKLYLATENGLTTLVEAFMDNAVRRIMVFIDSVFTRMHSLHKFKANMDVAIKVK
jgi:hypothetical protein